MGGKRKETVVYPPAYFLGAMIVMGALHFGVPVRQWLFFPWNLTALLPLLAGLRMMGSAARLFEHHRVNIKPFTKSAILVREGPFLRTRNPMYLGMVLMLMGVAALMGSVTPWLVIPVFVLVITRRFIIPEEEMLRKQFKEDYRAYCAQVKRWL